MNSKQDDRVTDREKNLIAMGAAMGGGCRTCSDKLYRLAVSLNIPEGEMAAAFRLGLEAKAEAVRTMEVKISSLLDDRGEPKQAVSGEGLLALSPLVRIASFAAANSAPDLLSEVRKATAQGIAPERIRIAISLARMVRKNAMMFSDQEIFDSGCGGESAGEERCCPLPADAEKAPACSCG